VRLLAVDVPATAKPGDSVPLTWTFEARGVVAAGWKLFVHLEGPTRNYVNGDHTPARPFEWWKPGQFIRYTTTVTLPRSAPKGRYTVRIGMFKGTTRAPASSTRAKIEDNAVVAATFEVVP
jgi:hypothetical protein